jgi:hypothetical protein
MIDRDPRLLPYYYGLLWMETLKSDARFQRLVEYLQSMQARRLFRILTVVHAILSQCEKPVTDVKWLKKMAMVHGLRIRLCSGCSEREKLMRSDIYFLLETLDILKNIQEKNCGKKEGGYFFLPSSL